MKTRITKVVATPKSRKSPVVQNRTSASRNSRRRTIEMKRERAAEVGRPYRRLQVERPVVGEEAAKQVERVAEIAYRIVECRTRPVPAKDSTVSSTRLRVEQPDDLAAGPAGDAQRAGAKRHVVGPPDRLVDRLHVEADRGQEHDLRIAGRIEAARKHEQLRQRKGEVERRVNDMKRAETGRVSRQPPLRLLPGARRQMASASRRPRVRQQLASPSLKRSRHYLRVDDATVQVWKRSPRNDL